MIKVCHMTSAHGKEDNRIFYKECISLSEAGYDVYLVQQGESYEKEGIHIIGAGELPHKRVTRMLQGAKRVYNIAKALDCDVYHIHDPELLPYGKKLKRVGKKVIFDSHELYREQLKGRSRVGSIVSRMYSIYEKKALKKIDAVIFPCPVNGMNPFEGMCNDFAYVNNVPRLTELYDKYDKSNKKYERSICYIGTISASRGITNIIKAASLSNTTLYLAGICHNNEYLKKIQHMPEYENVKYLGLLEREKVTDLLSHIQIGMATLLNVGQYSMADNLPTKVYEYMAMGIPSVISNTPYNKTIIEKFGFGISANPNNPEEIAAIIVEMLANKQEYDQMVMNGREAIQSVFNWEKESKALLALYRRIILNP